MMILNFLMYCPKCKLTSSPSLTAVYSIRHLSYVIFHFSRKEYVSYFCFAILDILQVHNVLQEKLIKSLHSDITCLKLNDFYYYSVVALPGLLYEKC